MSETTPSYQWMIERVDVNHTFTSHQDRWRRLWIDEKWELTVLLSPDRKSAVAFGCTPKPRVKSGGRPAGVNE